MAFSAQAPTKGRIVGPASAPLTIELFSDFECPGCKAMHEQILPPLLRDYVWTGKARLINHDFPLPMHKYARTAAQFACAAERVGKYNEVADALFRNQTIWSADGKVEDTVAGVLSPAEMKKVRVLATSDAVVKEVQGEFDLARAAGINSTPTMVVKWRGEPYKLPWPMKYEMLQKFLDGRLAK